MHRTTGTARNSSHDGQQLVTFHTIGFDLIRHRAGDFCATLSSDFGIKGITNRLSRVPCPFETESGNLRPGHLAYADRVFMTKLQRY